MSLTDTELQGLVEGITDAILLKLRKELGPVFKRLDDLEARPAGVKYAGVWSATASYEKDTATTWDGSLWVALTKSCGMKPGQSPGAWQLAVKRGSDGKSAQ